MLLKPATPLTILLLVAFALLLISCLSTPVVKGIPLATYSNVDYGVFGYCQGDKCTAIHVGYTSFPSDSSSNDDFNLPSSTRKSLSSILIVHPIAAFLTLVCLCLAGSAHFHGPSHSPRFLLALLILLLPTLLVTLLAFLVDILLFVPHMRWGGWIVLASTIILVSCGVVTCAMRRTLVSRKARKRRIAENAEMSGENYYNRQNAAAAALANEPVTAETKEAIVSGSPTSESGPTFAAFRTETRTSDDDRTPLNSQNGMSDIPPPPDAQYPSRHGTPYRAPRDDAGMPPSGQYGNSQMMRNPSDPRLRPQYSDGSMGSRRGGGPPGFAVRGRGGYPPRGGYGRGGPYIGAPRGPAGPRGGYMGGPMPSRGRGAMMSSRGAPRGAPGYASGPNRSFDSYGRPEDDPYDQQGLGSAVPMRDPSPGPIGMAVSSEPIGQAIEMQPQARHYDAHGLDPSMPNESQPHALSVDGQNAPLESPTSLYSRTESYVPARAGWGAQDTRRTLSPRPGPSPVHEGGRVTHGTNYYEDVDPRFARRPSPQHDSAVPSSLTPGGTHF
ncbi:pH-response regulator protein palI/RIM9 [Penicillium macrosclerotiorum]|uniref:pH-response regulator protein palI/RIM9 n=1 Tax=Penicillium macrosclerotiorum TaxID=303699 RepID=UPI002547449C|nr:pH-response regulator protein palI/RIM9 [Penicillium macrosclerotiorum]KAJ5692296.1 pH-response regulator protein palI/RIM9 [Penicillium macrosclerotiorum]